MKNRLFWKIVIFIDWLAVVFIAADVVLNKSWMKLGLIALLLFAIWQVNSTVLKRSEK